MTANEIEDDLQRHYKKILNYRFEEVILFDSLEIENDIFKNKFLMYTSKYPLTLAHSFDSLKKYKVHIVTSMDKAFRIYSWETWLGGTMRDFENVFQYKSGNKVFTKATYDTKATDDVDYKSFYSEIYSLKVTDKTYYLGVFNGIYSTKDASQSIKLFTIENNVLNDTLKLIKTKSGFTNEITVNFDFFSVVDRPERPLKLIKYDSVTKKIYIPIVFENGKVTDRFITYQFTGKYFEKMTAKK